MGGGVDLMHPDTLERIIVADLPQPASEQPQGGQDVWAPTAPDTPSHAHLPLTLSSCQADGGVLQPLQPLQPLQHPRSDICAPGDAAVEGYPWQVSPRASKESVTRAPIVTNSFRCWSRQAILLVENPWRERHWM